MQLIYTQWVYTAKGMRRKENKSDLFKLWAYQMALLVKNLPANTGDIRDVGSISGY